MKENQPDLKKMVNDLVAQIAASNHKPTPRADTVRKNLDKLGDWTTKKTVPVHPQMSKEEYNKLMMRATLELGAFRKKFQQLQSFVLADSHFHDLVQPELDAMQGAINDLEMILGLDFESIDEKDREDYEMLLRKREQFLRRFQ